MYFNVILRCCEAETGKDRCQLKLKNKSASQGSIFYAGYAGSNPVSLHKNIQIVPRQMVCRETDIVGLYLDQPDKIVVLCVDEKTQVQALDRTHPVLLMKAKG